MTQQELLAELEALRAENAALKAKPAKPLTVKVNAEKGTISVYGMGKFPVSLYRSQWVRLFAFREKIEKAIADNVDLLDRLQAARDGE